jgi:uncharacterized peroxidase-related enzyme
MSRITAIDPAQATGETRELLDATQHAMGKIPNFVRTLASSPAALKAWLESYRALTGGQLDPELRERLALGVADFNRSMYCLNVHTYLAKHRAHLSDEAIQESRRFSCADPKMDAALMFARVLLDTRGAVSDTDVERVRAAGYSNGEIAEIVMYVGLNLQIDYLTTVADTEIEFPTMVPAGVPA